MANLTRIVVGSELNRLFKTLDQASKKTHLQYKIYQINNEDKYRIVVNLPGFDGDWSFIGLDEPVE